MKKLHQMIVITAGAALLSGCASLQKSESDEPVFETPPVMYPQAIEDRTVENNGSLWAGNSRYWSLISDDKAFRAGDLITVNIIDIGEGESNTEATVDRKANLLAGITNFFGTEANFGDGRKASGSREDVQLEKLIEANSDLSFESDGELKRDHSLVAKISAVVHEVTPSGNLVVHGYKATTVGKEKNYITVEGLVRPTDLNIDNTIDSTKMANATIVYDVKGPTTGDVQRPGWMMQIFSKVWPF